MNFEKKKDLLLAKFKDEPIWILTLLTLKSCLTKVLI